MIKAMLLPVWEKFEEENAGLLWRVTFPCEPKIGDTLLLTIDGYDEEFTVVKRIWVSEAPHEFNQDVEESLELWLGIHSNPGPAREGPYAQPARQQITALGMSRRAEKPLLKYNPDMTVGELAEMRKEELLALHDFGRKSLTEVRRKLYGVK